MVLAPMRLGKDRLRAGATVAHLAFYLAEYLACDPIVFVGQDLGFSDGLAYTPGTSYEEVTLGTNWHPNKYIEFRPEIRGDFAGKPAFGRGGIPRDRSQFTSVMSALIKF